ncbi:DUF938 domain-containing protein [Niveispirillum irakense]|uniref:DUF938 domain-containing protein n=1 Tax=Niveispirillum irakense TaxID=34011 RepID=UPI0003F58A72|nr:DUF938 domain-containing protein [Niveispirillum irakense]
MNDDVRRHAPATLRNRAPILAILEQVLPATGHLLEVASGSGEHAVFLASHLGGWQWQPSDPDADARASIAAWTQAEGVPNIAPPLAINALDPTSWPSGPFDAMLCVNMIHIAPWEATLGLFAAAGRLLPTGAPLILYGPYKRGGQHTADSNAAFDADLRARDPRWGVRDLETVADLAATHGFGAPAIHEMPANNLTVIFTRQ